MMKFHFRSISRSRLMLMGFSALWIMLYHSKICFTRTDGAGIRHLFYLLDYHVYQFKSAGQTGVDIFLFLSAIGLYHSLEKNKSIGSFYKRRLIRILPEYFFVNMLWALYTSMNFVDLLAYLTGFHFLWYGDLTNWYFVMILFIYLIYPLIYFPYKKYGAAYLIILFALSIVSNLFLSWKYPIIFGHIEIALRRVPIFLLGSLFARSVKEDATVDSWLIFPALVIAYLSYSFLLKDGSESAFYYRYVCGSLGFCLIVLISYISDIAESLGSYRPIKAFLEFFGTYSMECYLLFEDILEVLNKHSFPEGTVFSAFVCFVLTVIGSMILKKIFSSVEAYIQKAF